MTLIINLLKCVVLKRWAELGCSFHSVVIVVVAVVPVVISSRNYFSPEIFPPLLILRIASGQENKEPAFNTSLITSRSLWRLAVLCFFLKPPSVGLCGKCVYGHVLIWTPSYLAHLDVCVCFTEVVPSLWTGARRLRPFLTSRSSWGCRSTATTPS